MIQISQRAEYPLAIAGILYSSAMWGLIWYPMRLFEAAGMSVVWVTLVMYLTAAVISLPSLWMYRGRWHELPVELLWLMLIAGITNLTFLVALIEGDVMRVMLLFFLSPVWTILIGRWWLGEQLSQRAVMLMLLAMAGTVMMLWHPDFGLPWPRGLGDWLGLIAGLCFSINNVLSRKLAAVPMPLKISAVFWGVVLIATLVLIWQSIEFPVVSTSVWFWSVFCGLIILTMTISVLYGLARMPVYRSAVIILFELVVAAFAAWLLIGEVMSVREWIGGSLIFAAAYGVAILDRRASAARRNSV
ncbi:DMT family transporter [Methylophaga lonarensis]|uniref:DMT family transporter n=1 Tax=Methylophaga lonarensis TaxID=999151 RepID=UPI003D26844B